MHKPYTMDLLLQSYGNKAATSDTKQAKKKSDGGKVQYTLPINTTLLKEENAKRKNDLTKTKEDKPVVAPLGKRSLAEMLPKPKSEITTKKQKLEKLEDEDFFGLSTISTRKKLSEIPPTEETEENKQVGPQQQHNTQAADANLPCAADLCYYYPVHFSSFTPNSFIKKIITL